MREFNLKIFTPDGVMYDDTAESIVVRTSEGDVCILYGHIDYAATIDFGRVKIRKNDEETFASCMGGMLMVTKGEVRMVATTFEFADKIDESRALVAKDKATEVIANSKDPDAVKLAELKLKRALNRLSVAQNK